MILLGALRAPEPVGPCAVLDFRVGFGVGVGLGLPVGVVPAPGAGVAPVPVGVLVIGAAVEGGLRAPAPVGPCIGARGAKRRDGFGGRLFEGVRFVAVAFRAASSRRYCCFAWLRSAASNGSA